MSSAARSFLKVDARVLWRFKDWRVDTVGADGSLVLELIRRGGRMRVGLTSQEVDRELDSGELRPYREPKQLDLFDDQGVSHENE